MKHRIAAVAGIAMATALLPAAAHAAANSVNLAELHGVKRWNADADREVWFEGNSRRWYRVDLKAPCWQLADDDTVHKIKFVFAPEGKTDALTGVIVGKQMCPVASIHQAVPGDDIMDGVEQAFNP